MHKITALILVAAAILGTASIAVESAETLLAQTNNRNTQLEMANR